MTKQLESKTVIVTGAVTQPSNVNVSEMVVRPPRAANF